MKPCFPLDVRSWECMSQTCEARVCVSYQHRLIFVCWGWMGDGGGWGGGMPFISLDSWTPPNTGGRWHAADASEAIRCLSLQMFPLTFFVPYVFWSVAALTFPVPPLFHRSNINLPLYLPRPFKAVDYPRVCCLWSNGSAVVDLSPAILPFCEPIAADLRLTTRVGL